MFKEMCVHMCADMSIGMASCVCVCVWPRRSPVASSVILGPSALPAIGLASSLTLSLPLTVVSLRAAPHMHARGTHACTHAQTHARTRRCTRRRGEQMAMALQLVKVANGGIIGLAPKRTRPTAQLGGGIPQHRLGDERPVGLVGVAGLD